MVTGQIVDSARAEHGFEQPRPGFAEQDAEAIWWGDTVRVVRELLRERRGEPAAVCVSGIGPCALIGDEAGRPLHPAILYGIDSRASAEIDELNDELGAEKILEVCGSPLSSQAVGPKLRWLGKANEHAPAAAASAADAELARRPEAHRRVRARPSQREPMRSALRPSRGKVDRRVVAAGCRRAAEAPAALAGRGGR